jgi:MFS family permease
MLVPILVESGGRDGSQVRASGEGRPAWPVVSAWALWLLTVLALAAVPLLDRLLRQAGRADLVQLTPGTAFPIVAMVSGATVGAVLVSRRPRQPVGWLLLAVALSLVGTAAAAQYLTWGLLVRPGALPAARWVALYFSAIGSTAMTSIGLLLLVTPTGSPPSPRWRWLAGILVATPVLLVAVATLTRGPLDPRYEALGGPFDLRGHGGVLLVANQVALAVTTLAVVVAAGSLVGRFRRARGVERLQLQWVALAALVVGMAGVAVLAGLAVGVASASTLLTMAVGVCLAALPVATGAAVLRYRLYDLDRIISRTLAYGLLTLLLAGGYAAVALGLGRLLGRGSSVAVAAATLAVAALFQPARRRIQRAVDRRFNRRRHDASRIIEAFGARLRDQVDLTTLTTEVMAVVDQTMQPTTASLWLRPGQARPGPVGPPRPQPSAR